MVKQSKHAAAQSDQPQATLSWLAGPWKLWSGSAAILVAAAGLGLSGCDRSTAPTQVGSTNEAPSEDGHDHADGHEHEDGHEHADGHEHDHHLGPNGGHYATLQPGDIRVEWVILDEGKEIQVFVPEAAEQVSAVAMHVQVGDEELEPYELQPAEELGNGAWRATDPPLFNHVKMTADHDAGVTVEIVAQTDGQPADGEPARATITHHQH